MAKSKAPDVPERTPEELALIKEQGDLLRFAGGAFQNSQELTQKLQPELLRASGLQVQTGPNGEITGISPIAKTGADGKRNDIENLLLDRSLAALRGDLPQDPILLRELEDQQNQLEGTLRKRLGPGFDLSSAGIESLGRQREVSAIAKSDSARKDLVTAEGLSQARGGDQQQRIDALINRTLGVANAGNPSASGAIGSSTGFQPLVSSFQNDRFAQFQADVGASQSGGILQSIGQVGGTALGAYLGFLGGGPAGAVGGASVGNSVGGSVGGAVGGGGGNSQAFMQAFR